MRLLLDSCVSARARDLLREAGHDVVWTGDWQTDPGDQEILSNAFRENRSLITLDKDFGELAIVRRLPHHGILRLVNLSVRQQGAVCLQVIEKYGEMLAAGSIITAEVTRIRIRPPA